MELHHMTVTELARSLDAGQVSSVEVAQHFLRRIAERADLGAFLCTDEEVALRQARAADERRARGERGPLLGVPIGHKDIFVTLSLIHI